MKSALIQFSVENFLSFKDRVTFSMETSYSKAKLQDGNCPFFQTGKPSHRLFVSKCSFILGANASGKSNLLAAMRYMDGKIETSHDVSRKEEFKQNPFRLNNDSLVKPSFFEMIFTTGKVMYQYNFEILGEEIISENLFQILVKGESKQLLKRNGKDISLFYELDNDNANDIKNEKTDSHILFVSAAQNWKEEISKDIVKFFRETFHSVDMLELGPTYTKKRMKEDENFKKRVLGYLNRADISINNITLEEEKIPTELIEKFPELKNAKSYNTQYYHDIYDSKGSIIGSTSFDEDMESEGTKTLLKFLGPIIDTLDNGNILLVDEFNSSLHPLLCNLIIELVLDENENKNNAQFIFVTHDTNILSNTSLNKDQFWFTERDKYGATSLYSLDEFDIRNGDKNYQLKYLNGRFGAVPFIRN